MEYDSVNRRVLDLVPEQCAHVLDIGCGGGSLGKAIRDRGTARVTGVTFNSNEAAAAAKKLDRVIVSDLNDLNIEQLGGPFDCLICSHVLEHLYHPGDLLLRLRRALLPTAVIVVAIPNILFWRSRLKLMAGQFRYTDGGLMDRTHYRFFDWESAQILLREAGYSVEVAIADGDFPLARLMPFVGPWVTRVALKASPGLFGWQFLFRARLQGEQMPS